MTVTGNREGGWWIAAHDPPCPAQLHTLNVRTGGCKNNRINSDNCTLNKMRGQRGEKCRGVTQAVWRRRHHGRQLAAPSNPLPHTVSQYHNSSLAAILQAATRREGNGKNGNGLLLKEIQTLHIYYSLMTWLDNVML